MLRIIWHMLSYGTSHQDPGADYFLHRAPERATRRHVQRLEALGFRVTLQGHPDAGAGGRRMASWT